jgi:hypothetical protein
MNFKWNADGVAFGRKALANARIAFSDAERGQVYERLSQAEKGLGHTDAAAQLARTAMSLDPSVDLTELLGHILLEQGRKSEAIVCPQLAAQFLALYVFAYDELAKRCHWPN